MYIDKNYYIRYRYKNNYPHGLCYVELIEKDKVYQYSVILIDETISGEI